MSRNGSLVFRHAKVYTPHEVINDDYIVVRNDIIIDLGREPVKEEFGFREFNLKGYIVGPRFIDTHIHGIYGYDTMNGEPKSLIKIFKVLPKYGVTGFIPTTVSALHDLILKVLRAYHSAAESQSQGIGTRFLSLHLEGPYVSPVKAGAQNKKYIRKPDVSELSEYLKASNNQIREITIALEVEKSLELIKYAVSRNMIVQIGHTNDTYDQAMLGMVASASKATHLYNGMRKIHHEEPDVVIALLISLSTYLELITDFIHVMPGMIKFTIDFAGIQGMVLITDVISATGLPDGVYELGGLKIKIEKDISRLIETRGLAGSTLTLL